MDTNFRSAYKNSMALLKRLSAAPDNGSIGFLASSDHTDNYGRFFTRDAFWMCMADMLAGESDLMGIKDSFNTMVRRQREDGAIPSNVSLSGDVSYGIMSPRVDPATLFIIGCGRLSKRYPSENILQKYFSAAEKAMGYLEKKWENVPSGLLYTPRGGNWADEYLQQGFVLYDEVLWRMALREYADMLEAGAGPGSARYRKKGDKAQDMIRDRFWVNDLDKARESIYGRVWEKFDFSKMGYFIHFYFSPNKDKFLAGHPCGIFDAFGNILAILSGVATEEHTSRIVSFIDEISLNRYSLIPAHYPFFPEETFMSGGAYRYRFKEFAGHFHNGGLWPWYAGTYVAALVKAGKKDKAAVLLEGIMRANGEKKDDRDFYEYHTESRARISLDVESGGSRDPGFSAKITGTARKSKAMVTVHLRGEKADAGSDLCLRALKVEVGDLVEVEAVGPGAREVLNTISDLSSGTGKRYFRPGVLDLAGPSPGGVAHMGVSAAAFIIGYKAYFDNKVIFE